LSNTLITLSDSKIGVDQNADNKADFYTASVLSATDYYAFGMSMKERTWQSEKYRYGFNGKENDTDWDVQDYGFRIYKPELGKFLSVDPLTQSYPELTPYQFASNNPILNIDLDGLEGLPFKAIFDYNTRTIVLVQPTAKEIKTLYEKNVSEVLHYAGHGDLLDLTGFHPQNYNYYTKLLLLSGCETGLGGNTSSSLNILILKNQNEVNKFIAQNGKWTQKGTALPAAVDELEYSHYKDNHKIPITTPQGTPEQLTIMFSVDEISSWGLAQKGFEKVLIDQNDTYYPNNTQKNTYDNANGDDRVKIIDQVIQNLEQRDTKEQLDQLKNQGKRRAISTSGQKYTGKDEYNDPNRPRKKVSVSGDKGVLTY